LDAKLVRSPSKKASLQEGKPIRVCLLSKVGDDAVGQQLSEELNASNVETSSQLFRRVGSTAFTTIIVSEKEQSRTCIFTPGSCGELSIADDVQSLSLEEIDELFKNVIHLHSDSRHTDVALWLAKEAKKRGGITISCDCEKDRNTKALDELIEVCDILFTSSNQLGGYIERLTSEREAANGRAPLPEPTITVNKKTVVSTARTNTTTSQLIQTYIESLAPSMYFARWQRELAMGKEVVVTHGSMGCLHYKQTESSTLSSASKNDKHTWASATNASGGPHNAIDIEMDNTNNSIARIRHSFGDGNEASNVVYEVHQAGVLKDAKIVDTTGAGDAFIGGYILVSNLALEAEEEEMIGGRVQFSLEVGSFVGGTKLGGSGARSALPTGRDFDKLGTNAADAKISLQDLLGCFNDAQ